VKYLPESKTLFTGSYDGRICSWDINTGIAKVVQGNGHTNQVSGLATTRTSVISCGMDDTVRTFGLDDLTFG